MGPESREAFERNFRGEVKKIIQGEVVRFALVETPEKGVVSFTLDPKVWDGKDDPLTGEVVQLSKLRLVHGKWRALQAKRIMP